MTASDSSTQTNCICTAVTLGTGLETPLLIDEESQHKKQEAQGDDISGLYSSFRVHGAIIGSLSQLVNVSGTTYMYYQWGDEGVLANTADIVDTILHTVAWLVSQADLYLYLFMWAGLTYILTRKGMRRVRDTYFKKQYSKRSVFVLGVQFYIGVVVGVFGAWTAIDCVLGLPVPILPMLLVFLFGLLLSYTMIWSYDMEDEVDEEDEEAN